MDAFETLRRQAVTRRDELINEARRHCRETLRWLEQVERRLTPPKPTLPEQKRQAVCDLISEVMPKDRDFTTADLFALVTQAFPQRRLTVNNVRSSLGYMEDTDRVRRSRLVDAKIHWCAPDYVPHAKTWNAETCATVAAKVLRERGPLRLMDLLVAVREAGFRSGDDPRKVRNALNKSLCTNPGRFKRDGKRWGVVS
jgi:hypothetical protein